jgi:hypothetical protein
VPVTGATDDLNDAVLESLVREAGADTETLGLILSGSRAAGCARPDSDYDVYWVLHDEALAARQARGEPDHARLAREAGPLVELLYTCPRRLRELAVPGWWTPGFLTARVLLDKTGDLAPALLAITDMPADRARSEAATWYDAYLNSFYRSLKAWRRGDVLGARLHAAESAGHLLRTLFPLEQRWAPYHDRLASQWALLAGQGWRDGELEAHLLALVESGEPHRQIELETRVEALLAARGFGQVLAGWEGDIEGAKAWFRA